MINETLSKKHKDFIQHYIHNYKEIAIKLNDLSTYDSKEAKGFLYELTRETINKEYNLENYFHVVDMLSVERQDFLNRSILETIWLIGFILEKKNETSHEEPEITKNFSTIVNHLLKKKIITQSALVERLEDSSLYDCGLIGDKKIFRTKITRINTKITYEQQKYNLFREESEGFSKLIFLLTETKLTKENLHSYINKILCLIGFFDLDPNRVLDITLTSFERDPYNLSYLDIIKLLNKNALPHILGFKFSHKAADDESGLYIVTAQLIKHGLIQLQDILSHFTNSLQEIAKSYKSNLESATEYNKSLHQRVARELTVIPTTTSQSTSENIIQTANYFVNFNSILDEAYRHDMNTNHIYRLFEGLVKVGSLYHCEIIYNMIEANYDPLVFCGLAKALCEAVNWMIAPIYEKFSLKFLVKNNEEDRNKVIVSHGYNIKINMPQEYTNDDLKAILKDNTEADYIIYDSDHNAHVFKQVETPEEFIKEVPKVLKYLTLGLSTDQVLFTKLLKIIRSYSKVFFAEDKAFKGIITDLICKVFLPSLSLIDPTPALVNELWSVMHNFDYSKRYKMYNYWINNIYNTHPALFLKHGVVTKEASKWQKTLSKENQRQHGRTLAILTNSNPIIVFENVIRLLTSYDNQINIFMQTLSFSSSLSYDIITYIISKIIADPHKEKINVNNGDMATWFKYFAYFIGHFFKKFHIAEFSGIMYYLCNRLKTSNSFIEFYAMKEIIEKMSGMVIMEELNEHQINCCAGGISLYLESMDLMKEYKNLKKPIQALLRFFLQNSEEENSTTTTVRLSQSENNYGSIIYKSNEHGENGSFSFVNETQVEIAEDTSTQSLSFTSVLLILLSTRRQSVIFNSDYTQIKLIGYLYDQIQNVYIQLVQFLSMHTDRETFSKFLPNWTYEKYVLNYNCQPEVVYFLVRNTLKPIYEMTVTEYEDNSRQFTNVIDCYQSINKKKFSEDFDTIYMEKFSIMDDLYRDIWKYISPELYFIFCSLQLKDIYVPIANYEKEIEKNKKELDKLNEENKNHSDNSQIGKNKKEIEKLKINMENLEKEMLGLKRNNEKVLKFLEEKKNTLLDEASILIANRREITRYLIQYCIYPRLIFSKVEALYSAKMLLLMINLRIPNFNVFDILQKVIKFIVPCILCVTEFEAHNIAIFLLEILRVVKYWQEENIWEEECVNNPSFSRALDSAKHVSLLDFKKVVICLLLKMNSTFLNIFAGEDYMSCKNAIIVLNTISTVYPPTKEIANELTASIEKALEKFEIYEDLSMIMKRYKDILYMKKINLMSESEITGDKEEKVEKNERLEKDRSASRDKKKKIERPEKRDKRRDDAPRTPDVRRRSPNEDYRPNKKQKK